MLIEITCLCVRLCSVYDRGRAGQGRPSGRQNGVTHLRSPNTCLLIRNFWKLSFLITDVDKHRLHFIWKTFVILIRPVFMALRGMFLYCCESPVNLIGYCLWVFSCCETVRFPGMGCFSQVVLFEFTRSSLLSLIRPWAVWWV